MLDAFFVFHKGGFVLWNKEDSPLKGDPIDHLVRTILMEERVGATKTNYENHTLWWSFANEYDLVFVAVHPRTIKLTYIDDLLERAKKSFCRTFRDSLQNNPHGSDELREYAKFDGAFTRLVKKVEDEARQERQSRATSGGRPGLPSVKSKTKTKTIEEKASKEENDPNESNNNSNTEANATAPSESEAEAKVEEEEEEEDPVQKMIRAQERMRASRGRGGRRGGKGRNSRGGGSNNNSGSNNSTPEKKKKGKAARQWEGGAASAAELAELDVSGGGGVGDSVEAAATTFGAGGKINLNDFGDESDDEDDEDETQTSGGGFFSKFLPSLSGRVLGTDDINPVLEEFQKHLISKNVATNIAIQLCESVRATLEGKKLGTFARVKSAVKEALQAALERILTPKRNIDILRDVREQKKTGDPYVVVFCGVNGVGKSTNLAKVCSWLTQNDVSVLIAACDTFRSGAVEQLKVHSSCLGVPLFQQGYGKDAAAIAKHAISQAKQQGQDVVLVDTAGRMQDNEPLMRSLAKLVGTNNPNLVLFVGEALVGNVGVEQLNKFNSALIDFAEVKGEPRQIDGIILTKFDTIDDKVGAALSMVYTTGHPIVFLGTGQQYTDLKRMNVKTVIRALLR